MPLPEERALHERPRFLADAHLGRLAQLLRLIGFDTLWYNDVGDERLKLISYRDHRVLLSRDRELLQSHDPMRGLAVRSTVPLEQLRQVVRSFDLAARMRPFERCTRCNHELRRVTREEVLSRLPAQTATIYDEFQKCPGCARVYWKGSHYEKMSIWIEELKTEERKTG